MKVKLSVDGGGYGFATPSEMKEWQPFFENIGFTFLIGADAETDPDKKKNYSFRIDEETNEPIHKWRIMGEPTDDITIETLFEWEKDQHFTLDTFNGQPTIFFEL